MYVLLNLFTIIQDYIKNYIKIVYGIGEGEFFLKKVSQIFFPINY